MWRDVTRGVAENPNCLVACHTTGILKMLQGMSEELEVIERALEQYLETKRQIFPRFYFISNDILLEILGCSKNPPEVSKEDACLDELPIVDLGFILYLWFLSI